MLTPGTVFEDLTVLARAGDKGPDRRNYFCRCVCGKERKVAEHNLKSGASKSCGCRVHRKKRAEQEAKAAALIGEVFGKLTAVQVAKGEWTSRGIRLLCKCACGREVNVPATALRAGVRVSCGCVVPGKLPEHTGAVNELFHALKKNAATRGLEVGITREEFDALIRKPCVYCGSTGRCNYRNTGLFWNGIDRVDSSVGYHPQNVVTCCKHCNYAKRLMTRDEFLGWVKQVATHQQLFK
jgi:hypothetical protein